MTIRTKFNHNQSAFIDCISKNILVCFFGSTQCIHYNKSSLQTVSFTTSAIHLPAIRTSRSNSSSACTLANTTAFWKWSTPERQRVGSFTAESITDWQHSSSAIFALQTCKQNLSILSFGVKEWNS